MFVESFYHVVLTAFNSEILWHTIKIHLTIQLTRKEQTSNH